ncbi:MAG: CotH kinase family protein, partial [Flavobacteriaceae bacterium]
LAELSDKTFIRNQIARYLGHMSSLEYTPSARYVEVVLNNEHQGLYLIGQKVEESSNRVDIGDDGYLVEIDQFSRIDEDDVYFTSDVYTAINGDNVFNIKEPNLDMDSEAYNLIRNQVEAFETALFSENFSDPETGYAAFVDVDSFIDWYVITEIAKSVDARWYSSIFFTYVPGEKIKMGPLWDFDLSFGNVDYADAQYSEGFWILQNPWIQRMYEDPAFREKVKTRFDYYYSKRSEIMTTIDDYSNQLEKSQELNYQRWPTLGVQVWPNPVWFSTYGEEVEHLKQWITERMNWLNSNL